MGIDLILGMIILILGGLFLLMVIVFFAMLKGVIKKPRKVDQAQAFIYRMQQQTHFPNHKTKQKNHDR